MLYCDKDKRMKSCIYIGIVFGILISGAKSIRSEETEIKDDSIRVNYYLNPILVTATKVAGAQRDLVASVSIIGSPKLVQAPTNAILEVVKSSVPGLYVTEWGVMGYGAAGSSAGKISIRGMGGGENTHVLILRNGRPDFMGLMGCTIADEFSTDGVERVEVLRGPASFLYGTNATGGVINIVSKKKTEDGFKTNISGGYGTFNSKKINITHSGKTGKTEYILSAATRKTDGHRGDANSHYEAAHYTVHVGYTMGENTSLELNTSLANIDVNDPGTESNPFTDHWYDMKRYGGDLTLVHRSPLGGSNLTLHGNFGHHNFYDGWRSKDQTLGIMVFQNAKPWSGNMTTIGFDYKRYGGRAENMNTSTDFGEYFITEYAPYMHTQQLLLKRFIVSAGFRMEHHELYGHESVPKLGLVTHISSKTSVRASAAKGFRSPSIRELYFFSPQNADLKPDRLWNVEVGLTQFMGHDLKFEGTLFRSEGSNLIRRSNPGFPFQWVNSGKFTHTGYELMLDWLPTDDLTVSASWSHLDLGNETMYSPGKKLTAHVTWRIAPFTASGDFITVHDLYGADGRENPMDDYALLNLTVQTKVGRFIRLKLSLKNVMDAQYQAMYGYPMPGRHVVVDVNTLF